MKPFFVSLTFDDGWKSAIERAYPLLHQYEVPATFYIISDGIDAKYPEYMDAEDLHSLATHNHEIGSHTRSHKHLPDLSNEEVWQEIMGGCTDLQALGYKPRTFAYPYGDWNPYVVKQVREAGFFAARSVEGGVNDEKTNPFLLRVCAVREEHSATDIISSITEAMKAMKTGGWLILCFHQIESAAILQERKWIYGTTPTVFEDILRFLKKESILTLTIEQGMEYSVSS